MSTKKTIGQKSRSAPAKAPASFVYRGVRIRWPQKRTKRTDVIYAAARRVMALGVVDPTVR